MKFKFLNAALASFLLVITNVANAGLIQNDLEWLDLDITTGFSYSHVEQNILTQGIYSDYRYATKSEVASLYNDFLIEQAGSYIQNNHYWQVAGAPNSDMAVFFSGAVNNSTYTGTICGPADSGCAVMDNADYQYTYFLYGGSNEATYRAYQHAMYVSGTSQLQVFVERPASWNESLGATTPHQVSNAYSSSRTQSLLVRNANQVPEPSTLAIFALGMIGFAARRLKKQA